MDRQGRSYVGRELAGAALLVGLLLLGLVVNWKMGRTHNAISRELEDAAWFALAGDWEAARMASSSAQAKWESNRNLSSLLADNTFMEDIDTLFARISIYSAARENTNFASTCAELSRRAVAMGEAHYFSWQNIL